MSQESAINTVGLISDPTCTQHLQSKDHQESPDRVRAIREQIVETGLIEHLTLLENKDRDDLIGLLSKFVDSRYLSKLLKSTTNHNGLIISGCPDTKILYGRPSQEAILAAVKSVPNAIDAVLDPSSPVKRVFCNVRPPGHHASDYAAAGFCFLNNVAIGAKYALTLPGIERVAILDWDLHRGDGTMKILKNEERVLYASLHAAPPFYPGPYNRRDYPHMILKDLPPFTSLEQYLATYFEIINQIKAWKPNLILISAGFDCHCLDLYHSLPVNDTAIRIMTRAICHVAEQVCEGHVVSVLEGGYTIGVLKRAAEIHVRELFSSKSY